MADPTLAVDPQALKRSGNQLDSPAERLRLAKQNFENNLSRVANEPWGDDEIGEAFANGDRGYVASTELLLEGLDNLTKGLGNLTDKIHLTADNYINAEIQNSQ